MQRASILRLRSPACAASIRTGQGVRHLSTRRPADVYVPHWGLHGPTAFNLAVSAGLRQGTLHHLRSEAHKPALDHQARKCSHLQTQELCSAQGIQSVPLVFESRGRQNLASPGPSHCCSVRGDGDEDENNDQHDDHDDDDDDDDDDDYYYYY